MDRDPSARQQAICLECATESGAYHQAAGAEARTPQPVAPPDEPVAATAGAE